MMLGAEGMRLVAKRARQQFASMLALELGTEIYSAAMRGANEVCKTFDLCAEDLNFNLACEIGEYIVSDLDEYDYLIDYLVMDGKDLKLEVHAFWGENKEDFYPLLIDEEE